MTIPELALLHTRHMQAMRLRDAYETRKAYYLLAAITDPKKRRTIKVSKLQLIKPDKRSMSAREILDQMRLMSNRKAEK